MKRMFDFLAALLGLLLLSPVLAIIAFLVRTEIGSPVFFSQKRPGLQCRPFLMYKFRTMTDKRDLNGKLLLDAKRLTSLGKFLRSTSLDELPELFNVLKGDMSLAGPRPLLMEYLDCYTPEQARRHEVKPGITGWAQVNGRNAISWELKFKLDVWYVDNWSLWLDVKILFLTVFKVINREGISHAGHVNMEEFMGSELFHADSISDFLFVSEKSGMEHLKKEGKREDQIFFVGNIMIDTLFYQLNKLDSIKGDTKIISKKEKYGVVTLHRPSNVDEKKTCQGIIEALTEISKDLPIVFPAHPRTKKNLESFGLTEMINDANIKLLPPQPYIEFLRLWKDAVVVFTDSGGIQEETTALGIPCFTIRENTERPITIEEGTNILVGNKKENILKLYLDFKNGNSKHGKVPKLWDGNVAKRIVNILLEML